MNRPYPEKIEHRIVKKDFYKQRISTAEKKLRSTSSNENTLQLKLDSENILQGVVFSEILGKPKGLRFLGR